MGEDARGLYHTYRQSPGADSLGIYGAAPTATPALDAFARDGLVFAHATAQAPWTMPSVASIMTGVLVRSHGVIGDPLGGPGATQSAGDERDFGHG